MQKKGISRYRCLDISLNRSSYNNVIKFLLYPQLLFLLVDALHRVNEKPHYRRQFRRHNPRNGSREDG